ncbi:hypothetical protein [Priestia megaterium]|uniref:hypothetical protein n=1 Tax=Priestia megaterium TaxID=1404 RepID=UPI00336B76FC
MHQSYNNGIAIIENEDCITKSCIFSFTSFGASDRMTLIFGTKGTITLYSDSSFVTVEKGIEEKQVYTLATLKVGVKAACLSYSRILDIRVKNSIFYRTFDVSRFVLVTYI